MFARLQYAGHPCAKCRKRPRRHYSLAVYGIWVAKQARLIRPHYLLDFGVKEGGGRVVEINPL